MSNVDTANRLDAFDRRVTKAIQSIHERQAEAERGSEDAMERLTRARARFDELAADLHRREIRPRLEVIARQFDNATLEHFMGPDGVHSVCTFTRTDRFPASAKLTVGLSFDPTSLAAHLHYRLEIVPVLMEFHGRGELALDLRAPDEYGAVAWLEERLAGLLDTYLRVGSDEHYQQGMHRVDPVCGMRVHAGTARHQSIVGRRTYYLCSAACRERFEADPDAFTGVRPLRAEG